MSEEIQVLTQNQAPGFQRETHGTLDAGNIITASQKSCDLFLDTTSFKWNESTGKLQVIGVAQEEFNDFNFSKAASIAADCIVNSICYAEDIYLIGTTYGLYKSIDGVNCVKFNDFRNIDSERSVLSIEYGDDKFLISTADNGLYSWDGYVFIQINDTQSLKFRDICYSGLWVAAGYSGLYFSNDAITWKLAKDKTNLSPDDTSTRLTDLPNLTNIGFYKIKRRNNMWVATSDDGIWYSEDGLYWTNSISTREDRLSFSGLEYVQTKSGNIWYAGCDEGFDTEGLWKSLDNGLTWEYCKDSEENPVLDITIFDIIYKNETLLALGPEGVYKSLDAGSTFTRIIEPISDEGSFNCVNNVGNRWLIGSTDGLRWCDYGYNSYYSHLNNEDIHVSVTDRTKWTAAYDRFQAGLIPKRIKDQLALLKDQLDKHGSTMTPADLAQVLSGLIGGLLMIDTSLSS